MSSHYSNPTANAAMGSIDKEIRRMEKEAKRICALRKKGLLTVEDECRLHAKFHGIFRPLWMQTFPGPEDEEKKRSA